MKKHIKEILSLTALPASGVASIYLLVLLACACSPQRLRSQLAVKAVPAAQPARVQSGRSSLRIPYPESAFDDGPDGGAIDVVPTPKRNP